MPYSDGGDNTIKRFVTPHRYCLALLCLSTGLCLLVLALIAPALAVCALPDVYLTVDPDAVDDDSRGNLCFPDGFLDVESDEMAENEIPSTNRNSTANHAQKAEPLDAAPTISQNGSVTLLNITPQFQADYMRVLFTYHGMERSVATSGCAAVCISMVVSFISPQLVQTPETILQWLFDQGEYRGNGFSIAMVSQTLTSYGIKNKVCNLGTRSMRAALEAGNPVIAFMGKGYFTDNGHYVLIHGIDEKNRLTIIDPNSTLKSEQIYRMAAIHQQSKGSMPYIVCYGADQR